MRKFLLLTCTILFISLVVQTAAQDAPHLPSAQILDLRQAESTEGIMVIYDVPAGTSITGKPVRAGDLNRDGCGDVALTGMNASHQVDGEWRTNAGHVRIVFDICTIQGVVDFADENLQAKTLILYADASGDMLGTEAHVSDLNGDGWDDLVVSAQNHDGLERSNSGTVYILFGSSDLSDTTEIDLRTPPANMVVLHGADANDHTGIWLESGNLNGDSFRDLVIGANLADGDANQRENAGEVWIIYGVADWPNTYGQIIDLSTPPAKATRFIGADPDDVLGSTIHAQDFTADGLDDLVLSASLLRSSSGVGGLATGGGDCQGNTLLNCGEVYILANSNTWEGQMIDFADWIDPQTGEPQADWLGIFYETRETEALGEDLASGDFNADGQRDLVLGAIHGDGKDDAIAESGEAWIIFNAGQWIGKVWQVQEPPPEGSLMVYPEQDNALGGDTVRVADWDGDGFDDLLFGIPNYRFTTHDGEIRQLAGILSIILGGSLPQNGYFSALSPANLFILGADAFDMSSYGMALYDMNADGKIDLLMNGMGGDGRDNTQADAGEIYIISNGLP